MINLLRKLSLYDDEESFWNSFELGALVAEKPFVISFLNAHAFNMAWSDSVFRQNLLDSSLLLRDGVGVKIGLVFFGIEPGLNLNGTDLIPKIIEKVGGKVSLYGTKDPNLGGAAQKLKEQGVDVVSMIDGFQGLDVYLKDALLQKPRLIVLAMGMPKQERVSDCLSRNVDWPCVIVNGGAILDFLSGRVERAPRWLRNVGLEWGYRLYKEPGRLWRRYLVGNFSFLMRLLILKLRDKFE